MRFRFVDYVVLIVKDIDRALLFYTDSMGITLGHRSGDYAQLQTGQTRISLYTRQAMADLLGRRLERPQEEAPAFELGFKVDDVDIEYARLTALGAVAVTQPVTRAWGQRTAYIRDPDGNLIELVQDLPKS